jgi:hypothetical protein
MFRLWIADPEAPQRRELSWWLRERFDAIDEFDSLPQLEKALLVAGPF